MSNLDDIVKLTVVHNTKSPDKTSFNIGLFITDVVPKSFNKIFRIYTDAKQLISDGFITTDKAYIAAQIYFSQSPKPSKLIIAPLTKKDDSTNDDIVTSISKISDYNNSWYGLGIYSKNPDDIINVARYIDSNKKIFFTSTNDKKTLESLYTTDSKDFGSIMKKSSFTRTSVLFSEEADKYPEMAMLGIALAYDAGTATIAYKSMSGIQPDNLSSTKYSNLASKNINTYEEIHGINVIRYGKFVNGSYIDVMMSIDFINARIQELVYSVLTKESKLLYDKTGVMKLESKFIEFLQYASKKLKIITEDYIIDIPRISEVSSEVKETRILEDIKFRLTIIGAVHQIKAEINYII